MKQLVYAMLLGAYACLSFIIFAELPSDGNKTQEKNKQANKQNHGKVYTVLVF